MNEIIIKKANSDIKKELTSINFDKSYINTACSKYKGTAYKIFNLKPFEATILKQACLSLGFDCAVSRETITCNCEYTDCILFGSISQIKKLIDKLKHQPFRLKLIAEELTSKINNETPILKIRNNIFDRNNEYIMGILNVTPNSFSDGGEYINPDIALNHAIQMINDGADIIDIGGESTKPNAETVTVEEEIKRVIPVIQKIRSQNENVVISIDTRNYETAKAAIEAGADIINDVSGLDYDSNMFNFVVSKNIPTVIMHSDKVPAISSDFSNGDIIEEIYFSLDKKIKKLLAAGMERQNIIADVGIGFGKSVQSNFEILKRIDEFSSLNVLMLLGISRKSFIRKEFNIDFNEADEVTALYSANIKGINIHRVHNVKLTKKYLDYCRVFK